MSLPTRSPSHRAQPRGKPGFSTLDSSSGRETDSPLEGAGFEPSVPLRDRGTLQIDSELFDPMIATHNGRLVKTIGGSDQPLPEAEIAKAVQLLDLMLEFFADDGYWTRGSYDDGNGGHCLVGALLHLSRKHRLPTAPAITLLQDAMPRPGLPLVHFNDTRCGSVAELRSVIVKARRLARDDAERKRAAAAVKTWLLAGIEKKRASPAADIEETAPDEPFALVRLAA